VPGLPDIGQPKRPCDLGELDELPGRPNLSAVPVGLIAVRGSALLAPVAFTAFVSLGLPDAVLGVAWPSIRRTFDLPISQLGVLLGSAMLGYLVSAFSSGPLVARVGIGWLLLWSSAIVAASTAGYALAPAWPMMVALGVLSGLGAGAIDTGINAFAAKRFHPRTVSWLHACWGAGAALGPLLMTALMSAGWSWRWGYALIAALLAGMSVCFALTVRLWTFAEDGDTTDALERDARATSTSASATSISLLDALGRRAVLLNVASFFVYTGLEATAGQWSYSLLTESRGIAMTTAGIAVGTYWGGLTVGRLLFGVLARAHAPARLLKAALLGTPLATIVLWVTPGVIGAIGGLALLGLAVAPIYPLMISLTPARTGAAYATHAVGFQVAAGCVGVAALPGAAGVLARLGGLEAIPPFMLAAALTLVGLHALAGRLGDVATGAR